MSRHPLTSTSPPSSQGTGGERAAVLPSRVGPELGRYELREHLGAGASGTVYRAIDRERGLPVALKILHRFDPARLAGFKDEFRIASRCSHRNLVTTFELLEVDGVWAIAMELVDGPPLLRFVRGANDRADPARLREVLRQVVEGLAVLHGAGMVHRDLKPSNLLVGRDGRVRIADFGLATLLDSADGSARGHDVVGTPGYMSPEQALGSAVGPSTDLYALGVLSYEALTGQLPFQGAPIPVLLAKNAGPAPDPSELCRHAPADLLDLTRRLLSRDPALRPTLAEVGNLLAGTTDPPLPVSPEPRFVGRSQELARLVEAYDAADDPPLLVRIGGPSGVGKSALARECARLFSSQRGALVLSGRCHELEAIPLKGFDPIADALRRALLEWPAERRRALVPANAAYALPMFPVLEDVVPPAATAVGRGNQRMQRAREAFLDLLACVGRTAPLVIVLDDAQWADEEGSQLLQALLSRDPPSVRAVVLASRDGEVEGTPLQRALDGLGRIGGHFRSIDLHIDALTPSDAEELAFGIVGQRELAARIAAEGRNEPFMVEQLALAARAGWSLDTGFADLVRARARALGDEALHVLEVAAVAGAPLPESLLAELAGARDARRTIHALSAASILRRSGAGASALVYPYHDRIRSAVASGVPADTARGLHLRIARLGEERGCLSAAELVRHFEAGGDPARAVSFAAEAAAQAERALAFEAAAQMHARVLDGSDDPVARQEARRARARCLFAAGRCDEAGEAFALAAQHEESVDEAHALRRQAVEAYLSFGRMKEGLALYVPMLAAEGLPYPQTAGQVVWQLVKRIALIRATTVVKPRLRNPPEPTALRQADLAWTAKALNNVAPAQGVLLTLASLSLALRSGEPFRIGRALGFAGCGFAPGFVGPGEKYLRWQDQIAESLDDDHLRLLHRISSGVRGFALGDWERCRDRCIEGLALAELVAAPTHWEQSIARTFACLGLQYLGEYRKLEANAREYLRWTRSRGDRIGEVMLINALGYAVGARHSPEDLDHVIVEMRRLLDAWTVPYSSWEAYLMRLRSLRALCWGRTGDALRVIEEEWPRVKHHRLLDLPIVRDPAICVRNAVLLESAKEGLIDRRRAESEVRWGARLLARASRAEGPTFAELARAGLARLDGDVRRAARHFGRAEELAGAGRMRAVALLAGRAQALLIQDRGTVARCEAAAEGLGVVDVAAWAKFITPGL